MQFYKIKQFFSQRSLFVVVIFCSVSKIYMSQLWNRHVLTAAHCVEHCAKAESEEGAKVFLGRHLRRSGSKGEEYHAARIFIHPRREIPTKAFDQALILLGREIQFSAKVNAAQKSVVLIGWPPINTTQTYCCSQVFLERVTFEQQYFTPGNWGVLKLDYLEPKCQWDQYACPTVPREAPWQEVRC